MVIENGSYLLQIVVIFTLPVYETQVRKNVNSSTVGIAANSCYLPDLRQYQQKIVINSNVRRKEMIAGTFPLENTIDKAEAK